MTNPTSNFSSRLFQEMVVRPEDLAVKKAPLVLEAACRLAITQGIDLNAASIEKEMRTEDPTHTKRVFEYHLYQVVGEKKIAKQVEIFKQQFEKTGIITAEELGQASDSIETVMSGEGQFSHLSNGKYLLFSRTLSELEKIHSPTSEKSLTQRLMALTFKASAPSELDRNRSSTIELIKKRMLDILELTHDDLIEPEEFNVDSWSSSSEEEGPVSIYPSLPKAAPSAPVKGLYPQLEETSALADPSAPVKSLYPQLEETSIIVDPGKKHHLLVSYIDLSFSHLFDQGKSDEQVWNSLPALVQKDALRHCLHLESCSGAAEELANRLFKTPEAFELQLKLVNLKCFPLDTGLSPEFVRKGEKLLAMYYSDKYSKANLHQERLLCLDYYQEFTALPPEPLFLQYVYEMAKAAGVQIADWDHHYAEYNWKKIDMIKLDVQALERCLHTKREG